MDISPELMKMNSWIIGWVHFSCDRHGQTLVPNVRESDASSFSTQKITGISGEICHVPRWKVSVF